MISAARATVKSPGSSTGRGRRRAAGPCSAWRLLRTAAACTSSTTRSTRCACCT